MKDGIDEEDGLAVFVVGQPVFLGAATTETSCPHRLDFLQSNAFSTPMRKGKGKEKLIKMIPCLRTFQVTARQPKNRRGRSLNDCINTQIPKHMNYYEERHLGSPSRGNIARRMTPIRNPAEAWVNLPPRRQSSQKGNHHKEALKKMALRR
ncbi:hypothetical protein MRB53_010497 [Persea americana]|uniref:Uncharacterized protein n=1 Tax=Persea americana TaxID=3435 RepID=A0ACC2LSB6_PERAE|nr:hypothetical protein MRB53_010497 [Persea americana]